MEIRPIPGTKDIVYQTHVLKRKKCVIMLIEIDIIQLICILLKIQMIHRLVAFIPNPANKPYIR